MIETALQLFRAIIVLVLTHGIHGCFIDLYQY